MRILQQCVRVYTDPERFEATVRFYEGLQGVDCERRVRVSETGVDVAKVGGFLVIAGDDARLEPVRHVDAIFYLDSLDEFRSWLEANGADILHGPRDIAAGRNLTARHPDGFVVEYFQAV